MSASRPPSTVDNLVEMLRWRAEVAPEERGFRFLENGEGWGRELSFADLERRARAIGARIQDELDPGDRALLLYPPSLEYVEAFFGCLYAGVIAVPAYPPNPRRLARTLPRLESIVGDSGAEVALANGPIAQMARGLGAEHAELAKLRWIATDEIETAGGDDWSPMALAGETVAFLQYTSGSTGKPKGVILDHRTLLKNEELIQSAFAATDEDVGVHWLPLYHDMGLIGAVIQPVFSGCASVLMSPLDFLKRPARWLEAISRFGGTVSTAPNFAYDLAVRKTSAELRDELDLSSWRVACNGAEPIRVSTLERFADYFEPAGFDRKAFMPAYGLAEVGLIVSAMPDDVEARVVEVEGRGQVSCGPPVGDFDVRIVKIGTRRQAPGGEVGEIWLRRGSVAPGYWKKEGKNAEIFGAHLADGTGPFLRTGDLGIVDEGEVVVTGRLKDLIVIRGVNHYPQDIEATVEASHRAMRPGCGAAFSVETAAGKEGLVVVQEANTSELDDPMSAVRQVREAITTVHRVVPHEIVLIESRTIEKTSSGKIRRFATKQAYEAGELSVVARSESPGGDDGSDLDVPVQRKDDSLSAVESWLIARVSAASGRSEEEISLNVPFSSYGIDSAEAVGIVGELETWLETTLSATALYDFPTISALANHLVGLGPCDEEAGDERERRRRRQPPTDVKERLFERALAVVGVACRFPGADGLEQYWELLQSGEEAIRMVPEERWEPGTFTDPEVAGFDTMVTDRGGFLDDISGFDAEFFGISAREARAMDPQQRLVMETAWHALEDAGWPAADLAGSRTGVFIGQSGSDFSRLYRGAPVRAGSGLSPSITANRLSYWLDLCGPSMTIDTACSSSLVALDQALTNLRAHRCDAAIVGGVNVILAPDMSVAFSQARMLSPKGQCRAFDAEADGYVRGEGCGVVVVKRLGDALEDGDRIRSIIRGGAVNQDGRTNGLTAPNGQAQRRVVEAALSDAAASPESVGVIEAHGTGTELGDAIEARALQEVFDTQKEGDRKVSLRSVKAQIGHLEAGAGVAGLIKAVLIAERGVIPPQPNFETANPACELAKSVFEISTKGREFPGRSDGAERPRRIGVSSFGFGGTNAHMVVEEPPVAQIETPPDKPGPGLVGVSAPDEERLGDLVDRLAKDENLWDEKPSVRDLGWSLGTTRDAGPWRMAIVADEAAEVRRQLRRGIKESHDGIGQARRGALTVGFAFSGQGSQYAGMGKKLSEELPLFREHFDGVLSVLEKLGCSAIRRVLSGEEEGINKTEFAQPALFAVEVGLAKTLADWGLRPDVVMGHSVGEFAAAHTSGELSLQEAALLVVERGRRMQQLDGGGAMAAIFAGPKTITDLIEELGLDGVDIAAINGERHIVVSGDVDQVSRLHEELDEKKVFVKPLTVSHAFHSRRMEPMAREFDDVVRQREPRKRDIDFVSTVDGRMLSEGERLDASYWRRHILQPVRFSDAVEALVERGVDLVVEIGPSDTLSAMGRRLGGEGGPGWFPALRSGEDGVRRLFEVVAQLWKHGATISLAAVNSGGSRIVLPKTPYRRQRYWPDEGAMRQIEAGE